MPVLRLDPRAHTRHKVINFSLLIGEQAYRLAVGGRSMRREGLYEPSPDERYLARLGTVSYILRYSRCGYREA